MASEFIGAGWAFPVRTDATGRMALVADGQELDEAIRLILGTAPGERPMRPEFGCGIHDLVFARADDETAARIAYEVRAALLRWEPRIEVVSVNVSVAAAGDGVLYIDLSYRATNTNDPRNLVFPFYTIPEER
ncbi:MAG: GPW/gp25 family protein [Chloroflexi bacterium]|nr:GPW/gp25 family protein [Chloroflexota bacterium]